MGLVTQGGAAHFCYDCQLVERPSMNSTLETEGQRQKAQQCSARVFKGTETDNRCSP